MIHSNTSLDTLACWNIEERLNLKDCFVNRRNDDRRKKFIIYLSICISQV